MIDVTPTVGEIDDDGYAATTFVIGAVNGYCEFTGGEDDWETWTKPRTPNSFRTIPRTEMWFSLAATLPEARTPKCPH